MILMGKKSKNYNLGKNHISSVKGLTSRLKEVETANQFKNPIKLALFTIFVYFSCISGRNLFILHKFH